MPRLRNLMLILPMLLAGCAIGPNVLVKAICPRLPELDPVPDALVRSYSNPMQNFLSGNLTEQTDYLLTSGNAKLNTIKPEKP